MADYKDVVQLGVDVYRKQPNKYSMDDSNKVLREALIEANGGSTVLDYKAIRDGKCNGVFSIVEQILDVTVDEGLKEDDHFNSLVEYRNVAAGDRNEFIVEDKTLFVIDDAAEGTQGVRRQRLGGSESTYIPTSFKFIRIYEELNRVLAGRVDFNHLIQSVSESVRQKLLSDVYTLWSNVTADQIGGTMYFPAAGSYDANTLLEIIAHVEAVSGGKPATIIGTKKAARMLAPDIQGFDSQKDIYNMGYYGKFYGTPVVVTPQRHQIGSTDFMFDDNVLTIIAGDQKPVKVVREGNPTVVMGNPTDRRDFTQEYMYGEKYGVGLLVSDNTGLGKYQLSN